MIVFLFKACVATFLLAVLIGIIVIAIAGAYVVYEELKEWKEKLTSDEN